MTDVHTDAQIGVFEVAFEEFQTRSGAVESSFPMTSSATVTPAPSAMA